ncbi:valine--tRNA ligase [Candidatus Portiera aleyrodidarum]|uniref:Valine--tRNA ligase n=1 Tax=Candidatus Portiera aleyrodidarum TaxID=91844 RepID=A0A8D9NAS2_9GAMM|nr:valine--tRNA ligase [Candidatus Portiera aleyrodidarum]CEI58624.1 Valine--tRNA ligase [Candidatus Portiera aleyrodidarum]
MNKLYNKWGKGIPFSIMIPPPNVNGKLHMGHAFEYTLIDTIIRYKRMQGYKTLLQFGTDHAGIATQILIENNLAKNKISRLTLGRKIFIKKTFKWCNYTIPKIILQMKRLGISVDWKKERFTMDYGFYQTVQEAFIKLYKEGLVYRGKRLINWDPILFTALSDIEVENIESKGKLWYIRYPLLNNIKTIDGKNYLLVATTRPETLLADTFIAVNPKDNRYKNLIGQCVKLPLLGRVLPIITDEIVDIQFGTGCVKITPAHNFIDYKIGKRNNSLLINIFTKKFRVRKKAEICKFKSGKVLNYNFIKLPKSYVGLSINLLRKNIVNDLLKNNFLEKKIDNYILMLPCGDRSGAVIEPLLTDQWFVSIKSLANLAINAVKNENIRFIPKNYEKIYINWMYNLKDWCISRQLWWGHRIPAWFDDNNNIFVGRNEEEIRNKNFINFTTKLYQSGDVLDTWFSSGLWTFSTIGWPQNTYYFNLFHPSSVLITGFDIIPFWVSRLIMMSIKLTNEIPFKKVYIHGLIRDKIGQKMSKSKGNVIDPLDLINGIEKNKLNFGADALRYTFLSISLPGKDINFDIGRLKCYSNFCNKLWNATRYVRSKSEIYNNNYYYNYFYWENLNSINRFIISILQKTKKKFSNYLEEYRFDLASQILYDFVWNEYCDWYLEFSKLIFNSKYILVKLSTINTLEYVLKEILLLLHPMIPFITEELWKNIQYKNKKTIILNQSWPKIDKNKIDEKAISDIEFIKKFIRNIRYMRASINIDNFKIIKIFCSKIKILYKKLLKKYNFYICKLAKIQIINYYEPKNISCLSKNIENMMIIHIPYSNCKFLIKDKELKKQKKLIKILEIKLKNKNFINKAPKYVIKKNKIKLKKAKYLIKLIGKNK